MKIDAFKSPLYLLFTLLFIFSCKKDEEVVVKKGEIEGTVKYFETNAPLINREVFLYGRQFSDNTSGLVKIASTTTDSSGQYRINFQFTDKIEDLNIWVSSDVNEILSGKDVNKYENTVYDLSGYSSCYLQGVVPNTNDSPIVFNTLNPKDIILYPYNTIAFTVINDSCYDYNDVIDINIKNANSNDFSESVKFIGNCDTSNSGTQYLIPPSVLRRQVTKNNSTTTHYDTLNPSTCDMLNYVIHY